jgi:hypothetical protein
MVYDYGDAVVRGLFGNHAASRRRWRAFARQDELPLPKPSRQNAGIDRPLMAAIKVGRLEDGDPRRDFTYCVTATLESERRATRRRRTRLRSGKTLTPGNGFLVECQIHERSEQGARLRLLAPIPIPGRLRLYEDAPERLIDAFVVWRRDCEIGICFAPHARSRGITSAQLSCLRGRYYAVRA